MGGLGCGFSVLAALLAVITALPLLGWANWITTVPLAGLAIVYSGLGLRRNRQTPLAAAGLAVGVMTLCWALFRLSLGAGIL